jgi:hypothetical protein
MANGSLFIPGQRRQQQQQLSLPQLINIMSTLQGLGARKREEQRDVRQQGLVDIERARRSREALREGVRKKTLFPLELKSQQQLVETGDIAAEQTRGLLEARKFATDTADLLNRNIITQEDANAIITDPKIAQFISDKDVAAAISGVKQRAALPVIEAGFGPEATPFQRALAGIAAPKGERHVVTGQLQKPVKPGEELVPITIGDETIQVPRKSVGTIKSQLFRAAEAEAGREARAATKTAAETAKEKKKELKTKKERKATEAAIRTASTLTQEIEKLSVNYPFHLDNIDKTIDPEKWQEAFNALPPIQKRAYFTVSTKNRRLNSMIGKMSAEEQAEVQTRVRAGIGGQPIGALPTGEAQPIEAEETATAGAQLGAQREAPASFDEAAIQEFMDTDKRILNSIINDPATDSVNRSLAEEALRRLSGGR